VGRGCTLIVAILPPVPEAKVYDVGREERVAGLRVEVEW
jgi:hypothetical protein